MPGGPGSREARNGKAKPQVLTGYQVAEHHLHHFNHCIEKGDIGKSFSHLSLALAILPHLKDQYYATYLDILEQWSTTVEDTKGFQQAMTIFEVAHNRYPDSPDIDLLLAKILFRLIIKRIRVRSSAMDTWRTLFRECLGGRGVNYCDEVAPLLIAVDQGVKPSLLWDVCTADTSALLALLNQARVKGLLVSKLVLVELELDVFIVNVAATTRTLVAISGANPTWLIDITGQTPKVASSENHQQFRNHLNSIISQLGDAVGDTAGTNEPMDTSEPPSSHNGLDNSVAQQTTPAATPSADVIKATQIKLPEDLNLSTIFGCLLGYPNIYWWEGESAGNSLSGMPLKVFKFSANCSIDSSCVELFSFSIPEALEEDLRPAIEHWGNVINVRTEQAGSFNSAKFHCDSVLCLSVAL